MRFANFIFLLFFTQVGFAQKAVVFPKITPVITQVEELVPKGWHLMKTAYGDLNKDGTDDLAVIIEANEAFNESRTYGDNNSEIIRELQKPRILLIYFALKNKSQYRLSVQNNDFILRATEGGKLGDPFRQIAIKDQKLFLSFQGGSEWQWNLGYHFSFQKNDWYLTGASNVYYNSHTGEMTEHVYNFSDRELYTTYGNMYQRKIASYSTSEVLYFTELRTFKTFKKPWAWEIMPNLYL